MSLVTDTVFYHLVAWIASIVLFILAVTGRIHSRWGGRIVTVRSVPIRIALFFISIAMFSYFIWTFRHQIAAALQ